HANRSRLATNAAAMCSHDDVELVRQVRELHRLGRVVFPREIREVLLDRPAVHRKLARARAHKYARDGLFAAARAVEPGLARRFSTQNFLPDTSLNSISFKKANFETAWPSPA